MKILLSILFASILTACATTPKVHYVQADEAQAADYKTFSIEKIAAKGLNPKAMATVSKAIKHALQVKGMTYQENNADLLVEFGIGIKQVQEVRLKVIPIAGTTYTGHILEDSTYATLLINISDTQNQKHLWHMSGSRKIEKTNRSQSDINEDFVNLLNNFK